MTYRNRFLMMVLSVVVAACAIPPQENLTLEQKLASKGYELGEQVDSIRDWNIDGWSYVDDQRFVMHSGPRDRYLITLRTHSLELRNAQVIGFSSTVSSVTDKDKVVITGPGDMRETLFIESLHRLKRVDRAAETG